MNRFPGRARIRSGPRTRSVRRVAGAATAAVLTAAALSVAGASSAHADISSSTWYDLVADNSGKCVDAAAAGTANGTAVQQYTCNGTTAQQWRLEPAADSGYYTIVNANGSQPAIDVEGPSTASGALIHLWSDGGWSSQEWQPVRETSGRYHFVNHYSGLCLDVPGASTADSVQLQQYTCNGTGAQSFSLDAADGTGGTPPPTNPDNPDLGPDVKVFTPSMSASSIQSAVDSVYASQESDQFGTNRYALLFTPGSYDVDVPVGFYTEVAGLGASPDDVSLTGGGVHVDAGWSGGNATQNFWRDVENLSDTPSSGTLEYAVSQADPFRRVDVHGNMVLDDDTSGNSSSNWSSGGFIGDSRISGQINSGTQQQFLTQDTSMGSWTGSNWNMVFVGDKGAPAQSFPTYTTVGQSPTVREKPYLYVDSTGLYNVMVPGLRTNASGPDWTGGSTAGTSIPITQFFVVKPGDTAATINAALAAGKNLLVTPGVYHLSQSLDITRPDTVVLGLGLATLVPDNGVTAITTADVGGIDIAGLIVSAGTTNSDALVRIGPSGSSADHASDPTTLQDVFFRVGGDVAGKATQSLVVNSADTIGSDLWIWRADHGNDGTVGWNTNTAANGLVVNGSDVTMYGLAVEHYQKYQTLWNGNGGRTYFYQSEMPYDVPDNGSWTPGGGESGYPSYKVADSVTSHQAWGLGVYCYFSTNSSVAADRAIEVPGSGSSFHDMVTVSLGGTGTIRHVIDDSGAQVSGGSTVAYLTSGP
ncbi:RICIN domain-containing protein [Streptomyces sp. ICBB 8177]|uniref:RICIN domain-containing protein n=1 Tax=Streptomyces sp. ICBB 8177 TaxID=563922 RepID=UPI000D67E266|nr:RICIN domain-containing protein [Streptomyces sp. ICBB 8177]PWI44855.1 coagulation factor 5/8 type domain-containing protein [Streptomyces sp. ICBB 8177]